MGAPNAGKSSLVNAIVGFNVCGESKRVHTTRENLKGVYTENDTQIELTDTPGCVTSKHAIKQRLEANFLKDPDYSCNYANIIAILYDCSIERQPQIIRPLLKVLYKHRDKKSILIMTKVDLVKDYVKRQIIQDELTGCDSRRPKTKQFGTRASLEKAHTEELFKLTEAKATKENVCSFDEIKPIEEEQKHWPCFSQVFQTSAFESIGIEKLREYFLETAYPNPWLYDGELVTNQKPDKVIVNIIKSKILDNALPGPTPYNLKIRIVDWIVNESSIEIIAKCSSEKNFYIRQMIGPKGKIIFKINHQIREALSRLYRCEVNFRLDLQYNENEKKEDRNEKKDARNDPRGPKEDRAESRKRFIRERREDKNLF